jgi:hypothetical protein
MTIAERAAKLETIVLLAGSHEPPDNGATEMCALEAVAWLAGEDWGDSPSCACPVIAAFVRSWNDGISNDETRTRLLRPLVPKILGTRSTPAIEAKRRWMIADWEMRVRVPAFLRLMPSLAVHADALAAMPEIVGLDGLIAARELAQAAQKDADAAWDAAGAAAWDAAWDAAGAAARDAAGAAAWDAAGAAAGAAAWDAAWDAAGAAAWDAAGAAAWDAARDAAGAAAGDAAGAAAWDAAWDAAGAAARDAAGDAAWDAAGDAAWAAARDAAGAAARDAAGAAARDAAGDAARDAARKRIAPTVSEMQASAQQLVIRLCEVAE